MTVAFRPIFAYSTLADKPIVFKELVMVRYICFLSFLLSLGWTQNASADFSAFIARMSFDDSADLEGTLGAGVRWGKSSRIFGGETSLMVARPNRADEPMTSLFWEGRFLLNVPTGTNVRPFASVGLGNMLLTSIDIADPQLPTSGDELKEAAVEQALNQVDGDSGGLDLQNNRYLSYGGGVRYALSEKMAVRLDLRQYRVFSFKDYARDLAEERIRQEIEKNAGAELSDAVLSQISNDSVEEKTVQHSELSLGILISF